MDPFYSSRKLSLVSSRAERKINQYFLTKTKKTIHPVPDGLQDVTHGIQCINFLINFHCPKLCSKSGSCSTGNHNSSNQRPKLTQY